MLAACSYTCREVCESSNQLLEDLEAAVELRNESGRDAVDHCRRHYTYWGCADVGGKRSTLREMLEHHFDDPVLKVYEAFADSRFGAWQFEPGSGEYMPTFWTALGRPRS